MTFLDVDGATLMRSTIVSACFLTLALAGCDQPKNSPAFPAPDYEFGDAIQGHDVDHAFPIRNATDQEIRISRIGATDGLTVMGVDSVIAPGDSGFIRVRVATTGRRGEVAELANVYGADTTKPIASLHVRGNVVLPLEVSPRRQAYFFTVKGEGGSETLTLVAHDAKELNVTSVTSDHPRFSVKEEDAGDRQRRKLTVTLDPATPAGKYQGLITVTTTSAAYPKVTIPTFAEVKDSLSTSIDTVRFGQVAYDALSNEVLNQKSVLVSKRGGDTFRVVGATTDVPFMRAEVVPQAQSGNFIVNVRIAPKEAKRGRLNGTLRITTNDPSRPSIELPIRGNIV